ncbi:beta-ketoacyl-[acyl-carrier-protein] synthase family protein [Phytohabitans sp. LJ34]|uniref:beta-ketoacyl-[acyl-carrier-protein] synthase family protein n=1 Tax=Phytohabitans sp. LJ34 TaxID=3452217 RepID=UPI003F894487
MTHVVITGVGAVTPAGIGPEALWAQALSGRSRVRQIDRFDASPYLCQIAGQADAFVATDWLPGRFVKKTDRFTHLATAAAGAAIEDAGLRISRPDGVAPERVGVTVGNVLGGWEFAERGLRDLWAKGPRDVSPYQATAWFPAAPQGNICITFGIKGRARTFVCDRASGAYAIVHAAEMIRRGHADVVIAGGSEQPLSPYAWACCETGGFLTPHGNKQPEVAYRPFDRGHTGTAIGEGAAFLVIESADHARSRGAKIHGELAGWATNTDGYAPTYTIEPNGRTLSRAIAQSMERAGIAAGDLGCLYADGSGVPREDAAEVAAIKGALGSHRDDVPVTAAKPATGHLMGAAAVADVVAALRTLSHGLVPPVANLERPAAGFDLDFVTGTARDLRGRQSVAVVSRGLGGVNACLVLKRWPG